jgi:hypothetical protein
MLKHTATGCRAPGVSILWLIVGRQRRASMNAKRIVPLTAVILSVIGLVSVFVGKPILHDCSVAVQVWVASSSPSETTLGLCTLVFR